MRKTFIYLKSLGYTFGIILLSSLTLAIFCYYTNINNGFISLLKLIIPIISIFISAYLLGKITDKKGYLEGIKLSLIFIVIVFFITLISGIKLGINTFLYYILLILSSTLGASIGINKKKSKEE